MRLPKPATKSIGAFEAQSHHQRQTAPRIARALMLMLSSFLVFAVIWSANTEMRELVRAEGEIAPVGELRRVDHFDGGIVAELYVTVGTKVAGNQPLARIENPGLNNQIAELESELESLNSEVSNLVWILEGEAKGDVSRAATAQRELFVARQKMMRQRTKSLIEAVKIAAALRDNAKEHLSLSETSLNRLRSLHERGVVSQSRLLAQAEEAASIRADYYRANENYSQAKLDASGATAAREDAYLSYKEENLNTLDGLERAVQAIQIKLAGLNAQKKRQILRAPESGVIQSISATTVGEVIPQGGSLFELLPSNVRLIAVVKIDPKDVGHITEGSNVIVKIATFDARKYGEVRGSIELISPTSVVPDNAPAYYMAQLALAKSTVGNGSHVKRLRAGMTLSAEIETSKRTVLSYLLKPIQNALELSLTER